MAASDGMISVSVALRVRPTIGTEEDDSSCIRVILENKQIIVENNHRFTFDYVFSEESSQEQLYEDSVAGLLHGKCIVLVCGDDEFPAVLQGFNATILAYGQTNSGKTYTMGSASNLGVPMDKKGIIPRVIDDLFSFVRSSNQKESRYAIKCQFVEVYGEYIRDLLSHESDCELILRESSEGEVFLSGCQETAVSSANDLLMLLEKGSLHRTTGTTMMNEHSSRSHAVFIIIITNTRDDDTTIITQSKFSFVDLAGSERAKRTQSEGVRFREGIEINKGLLALGNVISVLGDETKKGQHVPYRDSKLTRLLQDSLGGNSKTLMICCVSPSSINMMESLNVLKYANRARNIKNKPVLNKDTRNAKIDELKLHVQLLAGEVIQLRSGHGSDNLSQEMINDLLMELSGKYNAVVHLSSSSDNQPGKGHDRRMQQQTSTSMTILNDRMMEMTAEIDVLKTRLGDPVNYDSDTICDGLLLNDDEKVIYSSYLQLSPSSSLKSFMSLLVQYMKKFNRTRDSDDDDVDEMTTMMMNLIQRTHESLVKETNILTNYSDQCDGLEESDRIFRQEQKNIQYEVTDLTESISIKNQLLSHLQQSQLNYDKMKTEYESKLQSMSVEVEKLESERRELIEQINGSDVGNKQYLTQNLEEKEKQLQQLRHKQKELEKLLSIRSRSKQRLDEFEDEITNMKRQKIELIRKMDAERRNHTKSLKSKVQEIEFLRRNNSRATEELKQVSANQHKYEQVIRKQTDEVNVYKKRLQDVVKESMSSRKLSSSDQKKRDDVMKTIGGLSQRKHLIYRLISEYESKLKIMKTKEDLEPHDGNQLMLEGMAVELQAKDGVISELERNVDRLSSIEPSRLIVDCDSTMLFDILVQTKCQLDNEKRSNRDLNDRFKTISNEYNTACGRIDVEKRSHRIEIERMNRDFEMKLNSLEVGSYQSSPDQLVSIANERCEVYKMESDRFKARLKLMEQEVIDLNSLISTSRQLMHDKDDSIKYYERDLSYFIQAYESEKQKSSPVQSRQETAEGDNPTSSAAHVQDTAMEEVDIPRAQSPRDDDIDEEACSTVAKFAHITRELLSHAQSSKMDENSQSMLSDGRSIFDRLSNPDSFTGIHRTRMAEAEVKRQRTILKERVKPSRDKSIHQIVTIEDDDLMMENSSQAIPKYKLVVDPFPVLEDLNMNVKSPTESEKYSWLLDDEKEPSKAKKVDLAPPQGVFNRLTSQMTLAALEKRKSKNRRSDG